jgi:beta-glucosidase
MPTWACCPAEGRRRWIRWAAIPYRSPPNTGIFDRVVWHRSSPLKAIRDKAPHADVQYDAEPIRRRGAPGKGVRRGHRVRQPAVERRQRPPSLSLPGNQDALVSAVAAANPHTIVVLETGGAVTMPWIGQVSAAMEAWYPGIRGGEAIANILFGDVNPSAKLPLTFAKSEADLPHPQLTVQPPPASEADMVEMFPGFKVNTTKFDVAYDEGLLVGYKWYDAKGKTPLFPFGFGLSYTTYKYSNLKASKDSVRST